MKRLPIFVLSILLLAVGCEPETILNVPTTPLQFDSDGGTATVDFVANKVWSVSSDASWCKIPPGTGAGSGDGAGIGPAYSTVKSVHSA